jgi:hypothetical protein
VVSVGVSITNPCFHDVMEYIKSKQYLQKFNLDKTIIDLLSKTILIKKIWIYHLNDFFCQSFFWLKQTKVIIIVSCDWFLHQLHDQSKVKKSNFILFCDIDYVEILIFIKRYYVYLRILLQDVFSLSLDNNDKLIKLFFNNVLIISNSVKNWLIIIKEYLRQ